MISTTVKVISDHFYEVVMDGREGLRFPNTSFSFIVANSYRQLLSSSASYLLH